MSRHTERTDARTSDFPCRIWSILSSVCLTENVGNLGLCNSNLALRTENADEMECLLMGIQVIERRKTHLLVRGLNFIRDDVHDLMSRNLTTVVARNLPLFWLLLDVLLFHDDDLGSLFLLLLQGNSTTLQNLVVREAALALGAFEPLVNRVVVLRRRELRLARRTLEIFSHQTSFPHLPHSPSGALKSPIRMSH